MPHAIRRRLPAFVALTGILGIFVWLVSERPEVVAARTQEPAAKTTDKLDDDFPAKVLPFVNRYCVSCHGPKKQSAALDLSKDVTAEALVKNFGHWELVLERLIAKDMPPEDAGKQPDDAERTALINWLKGVRTREANKNAGDPGIVLARRLSNAEYDNTIRDLTGIDIRPTKEFPVDPANQAGFDNSGESLTMSPALLKKFLGAARLVADHIVFKPEGFVFAPHPVVTDTDRDKYCVKRILDFYKEHHVDLADYFHAAWKFRHRAALGVPDATLEQIATQERLSSKYLAEVSAALAEKGADSGPMAEIRKAFQEIKEPARPNDNARGACEKLRDLVMQKRKPLKPKPPNVSVNGISGGSQTFMLYRNRHVAARHRVYEGPVNSDPKIQADLVRFCSVFPDAFYVSDRSSGSGVSDNGKGRPLTAGFHLMQGYFREDAPLCELVLTDAERKQLDELWFELDFLALAKQRQYADFIFFERAEPPQFMQIAAFDFARSEDKDSVSEAKMKRLSEVYLEKAKERKANEESLKAIQAYFTLMSADLRRVEKARLAAERSHLDALLQFAEKAYRRPLSANERDDLLAFYRRLRQKDELGHEEAIRDTLATVLMSPHACYKFDLPSSGRTGPLNDFELASRLSYFLWSSRPDAELLRLAATGQLRQPDVLKTQTKRMLRDPKARGLALEFAGNWLDFRRFEEHNAVDKDRFPGFTNELRQAMFEEPVRYFLDVAQSNRSVLDFLHGRDTFVNKTLARHYGMPEPAKNDEWVRVADATKQGRGGLLPMAVFMTKNAPGLRTSPVKRGYWVVRSLLGERIPPPPPSVPELPKDESKLGDLTLPQALARHRDDKNCAGCHNRFDSIGLAFEGYGPVGERRAKDLGGKPVQNVAAYPDGKEHTGIDGLRQYLGEKRDNDFADNLTKKLFTYALGRSLTLSDSQQLDAMRARLKNENHAFGTLVEAIVLSPQFLTKR